MRGILGARLLWLVFIILIVPGATAWSVTNVTIEPSGAMISGSLVIMSVKIDFPDQMGIYQPHAIRLVTDLERPKWTPTYITKGYMDAVAKQPDGGRLNVYDYYRACSSGKECLLDRFPVPELYSVRVTLEGEAPFLSQTKNITIIRVEELDVNGNIVASAPVYENVATVVNETVTEQTFSLQENLESFRSHISEAASKAVNVTAAETRFAEANNSLNAASLQSPAQYDEKSRLLRDAEISIADGERLLDKAWAEKEVGDAQELVDKTDEIIGQFPAGGRPSDIQNSAGFRSMIAKRESAVRYISTANDQIAAGNFSAARVNLGAALVLAD